MQPGPDGKLTENFHATERNGKPVSGDKDKLKLPVFLRGGFQNALDYFRPEVQACYRFQISGNRIDFESTPGPGGAMCPEQSGVRGFALLEAGGNVAHLERTVDPELARNRNAAPFAAIDLDQVELGGTMFSLSSHVRAENAKGNSTFHWEANYTGCRLFHVSVTLSPAGEPAAEPKP